MTDQQFRDSMTRQMAELIHHVAEVRKSNTAIQIEVKEMREDLTALRKDVDGIKEEMRVMRVNITNLDGKVDKKTDALSDKFSHFLSSIAKDMAQDRARMDEKLYDDTMRHRTYEERFVAIERRLNQLESNSDLITA